MYERIFDISKMIAKIDIMIFCNIAPHSLFVSMPSNLPRLLFEDILSLEDYLGTLATILMTGRV